jgi:TetR/AcrR family transcriptional repressor of nem operon
VFVSQLQPSTAKGQSTRARIVQAAAELVAEKGAAATSLDDVGARAHASRSQLYHYFEDRDDLIRAVVGATTDSVLLAQDGLLDHLDTWAGIDRWFRTLVALQKQREARGGCPIGSLVGQLAERDPLAREALADGFERWEAHLRDGLERMQARGRLLVTADPAGLATATMALLQGGLLLTQVRRDPKQLRTALAAARVLLRSAAA